MISILLLNCWQILGKKKLQYYFMSQNLGSCLLPKEVSFEDDYSLPIFLCFFSFLWGMYNHSIKGPCSWNAGRVALEWIWTHVMLNGQTFFCREIKVFSFPTSPIYWCWRIMPELVDLIWLFLSLCWDGIQIRYPQMLLKRLAKFCLQVSNGCGYDAIIWSGVIGCPIPD